MRASYARTHAHRTKNCGTARGPMRSRMVPVWQLAQKATEKSLVSGGSVQNTHKCTRTFYHSLRNLSSTPSAPFLPRKRRCGRFLLSIFIFIHAKGEVRRSVQCRCSIGNPFVLLIIITFLRQNRLFLLDFQPRICVYTLVFTFVKLFKAIFGQKSNRSSIRAFFAFCTKFELLFLHMYNLHNLHMCSKGTSKFKSDFL